MMDNASLLYNFNAEELKALALIIRKKQNEIPKELFSFVRAVQNKIYNSLSIDEAEQFYQSRGNA